MDFARLLVAILHMSVDNRPEVGLGKKSVLKSKPLDGKEGRYFVFGVYLEDS